MLQPSWCQDVVDERDGDDGAGVVDLANVDTDVDTYIAVGFARLPPPPAPAGASALNLDEALLELLPAIALGGELGLETGGLDTRILALALNPPPILGRGHELAPLVGESIGHALERGEHTLQLRRRLGCNRRRRGRGRCVRRLGRLDGLVSERRVGGATPRPSPP